MNSVSSLLLKPFSLLSSEEKLKIKNLGRPTPTLKIEQNVKSKNRQFTRAFKSSIYDKYNFICGCEERNSLYCFPCLCFGGEEVWTKTGVRDINHLAEKVKKHTSSKVHIKNSLSLSLFGKQNVARQLDSEYRKSIHMHNENVKNNRYVLNIIINCIRFCGAFELPLRGHDETESSSNPGVFRGLVNFSTELDNSIRAHLEKATVFKGTSKTIQNELLQIMLQVCHEEIIREIREADFLSVIADETNDVSNTYQMVVIFRYICKGKPIERFWNFITPEKHDAKTLTACLLKEFEKLGINEQKDKLISQTYDGANVMKGVSGGVQAMLKQVYPRAEYIHCHAHQLNLVMFNVVSVNKNISIFFAHLQGICAFFSTSPQRTAVLDQVVKKRLPRSIPTRWNFHSRSVNTVYENREEIKECFQVLLNGGEYNANTISLASAYLNVLERKDFNFFLSFFHNIMPNVDILYAQLQKMEIDPSHVKKCIDAFERKILSIRGKNDFYQSHEKETKRRKTDTCELRREAKEICDTIICQIKDRFKFTGHLIAASLFQPEMFQKYDISFPDRIFNETCEVYPFIAKKKLRTELSIFYSREEFRSMSGAVALLEFINENNLEETFSECVKLLHILITMPMTTSEAERCFSTLKRIKTFVRNTMGQEKLSALAMLSVEKDFIMNISEFNRKVIDKFAQAKDRRIDLLFK